MKKIVRGIESEKGIERDILREIEEERGKCKERERLKDKKNKR